MQDNPQIVCLRIRDHDELQRSRSFVIMQLVVARPIRYETSTPAISILTVHVSQREYCAENQFCIILSAETLEL